MNTPLSASTYYYLDGTDWAGRIGAFAALKDLLGSGMERNHLIPASFFKNGPPETRDLGAGVPCLPLESVEHRGKKGRLSFHYMPTHGLNDYLASKGLPIKDHQYSSNEMRRAIGLCRQFYKDMGMIHCALAIDEFTTKFYNTRAPDSAKS